MKLKTLALSLLLGLSSASAFAEAQYQVRVPANVNLVPPLSLALSAEQPDVGVVGTPYSFSLSSRLSVFNETGAYNLNDVTWAILAGTLPEGLLLEQDGVIAGTPSSKTSEAGNAITVSAAYGAASASQTYVLKVDQKACDAPPLVLSAAAITSVTVPEGCMVAEVKAWGAGGGGGRTGSGYNASSGGSGAFVHAKISVTPGQSLKSVVGKGGGVVNTGSGQAPGGNPGQGGAGKHNDGTSTVFGGGGGGYTGLFVNSESQENALVVSGGGSGGSSFTSPTEGQGGGRGSIFASGMAGQIGSHNGYGGGGGGYFGGASYNSLGYHIASGGKSFVLPAAEVISMTNGINGAVSGNSMVSAPHADDPDYGTTSGQGGKRGDSYNNALVGKNGRMVIYWH